MATKIEESFHVVPREEHGNGREAVRNERERNERSASPARKMNLSNMVTQSKYKLMASFYNIVHSKPAEPPPFSLLPVWLMGRCYHQAAIMNDARPSYSSAPASPNIQHDSHIQSHSLPSSPSLPHNFQYEDAKSEANNALLLGEWTKKGDHKEMPDHLKEFFLDFQTRLWFCYRKDFVALEPLGLTTDLGWGCMLRTGQMMMAAVLMRLILGRDWRLDINNPPMPHSYYRQIVRWFNDDPSESSPYSIHNLLKLSRSIDKKAGESASGNKVGEWFTPTRVSQIFKKIVSKHAPESLQMYVSGDSAIYKNHIYELCTNKTKKHDKHYLENSSDVEGEKEEDPARELLNWLPVFIQIPLRLGLDKIGKSYVNSIRHIFTIDQNVGIIGGKPKQSLYFVGFQGDQLIFLDPHEVRPSIRPESPFELQNVHCSLPQKMPIESMDPSLSVGFFCYCEQDFENLCQSIQQFNADYPESAIITVENTAPDYVDEEIDFDMSDLVVIERN